MAVLKIGHMLHVATRFGPHRLAASPQPGMCQPALMHCHRRRQLATSRRIASGKIVASAAVQLSAAGGADSQQSYSLSLSVADAVKATGLVHRCLVTEAQNVRRGTSSTLTRSEVRGGGKKPYAQKGTGNARSGSRRSPLRPGGGITFGPKPTDWAIKVNKKERRLAVATALQSATGDMLVAENIRERLSHPRTAELASALFGWGMVRGQQVLLIVEDLTQALHLASRNMPDLMLTTPDRLVLSEILKADKIIIEPGALMYIQELYGG
ncbi:hypothetical protein CVIRNUC_007229 [Coccomyxa viridis]|uniref:Large ribosomal subunit protein uL4c n=1 Tax=Coccomyxa viridis TaxID=1274662 RepID=A0AAV1IBC2_9CHLO|nr:hypothetical protein CVIRNUC_007229 [Coccomyxa viridis]